MTDWPEIPENLEKALILYVEDLGAIISLLTNYTKDQSNLDSVKEAVHRLRGSSGFFCFQEIATACEKAENDLSYNAALSIGNLLPKLVVFHNSLKEFLKSKDEKNEFRQE